MNWLKTTSQYLLGQLAAIMPLVRSTSDTPVELSAEVDANGRGIQRVVDAAPWAYDPVNDLTKTSVVRRESTTIQTHNASSTAANNTNYSSWISAVGFEQLSVGMKSDASHTSTLIVDWSASNSGTDYFATDTLLSSNTRQYGTSRITVKGPWFRVGFQNGDGVSPHTVSTWTTLIP